MTNPGLARAGARLCQPSWQWWQYDEGDPHADADDDDDGDPRADDEDDDDSDPRADADTGYLAALSEA